MEGIIVKAVSGFYYVKTDDRVYACKARGLFKNEGITPYVGDEVSMEVTHDEDGEGFVTKIHDRKNSFIRPPIANVEQFAIVVSSARPNPNTDVLDKFLVMAERNDTDVIIVITKTDIDKKENSKRLMEVYEGLYPIYRVNGKTGEGIEDLKEALKGKRTAFAGASGVGKSTILNHLHPDADAKTGNVSKKTNRGRHTTRHVELYEMEFGGEIYDTPGFTSFEISGISEEELQFLFPEIRQLVGKCKFDDCRHLKEPDCAVTAALKEERISESRYASYVSRLEDIRKEERK